MTLVSGCGGRAAQSELLSLSLLDETIVEASGQETKEIRDPFNLLKRGEAYFVQENYDSAAEAYQQFLKLYPSHRMAAYAQFSVGLCFNRQITSIDRDPTFVQQALIAFNQVLANYPESLYLKEASLHISELTKKQAEYEFSIGHFYYKQENYLAAIVRLQNALNKAPDGAVREKTLYYIGQAYRRSGNEEKAKEAFDTLRKESPTSSWTRKQSHI